MDNTVTVTLTVDDQGSAKVLNFKKNLEGAGDSIEKAGKQTETSRLGFFAFGNGVEDAARSMGVAGQASRRLGSSVERTAATAFPMWGTAIGGVTLAVTVAAGVIAMFIEQKKRQREETDRLVTSLQGEVDQLYKNTKETDGLKRAKYNLLQIEREQLQLKLADKYQDEHENLQKLNKAVAEGPGGITKWWEAVKLNWTNTHDAANVLHARIEAMKASSSASARTQAAELEVIYERIIALNKAPSFASFSEDNKPQKKDYVYDSELAHLTAVDELWSTQDKNYQGHLDMQQAIFDAGTTAKLSAMRAAGAAEEEILDAFLTASLGKERLKAAESIRIKAEETARKKAFEDMTWNYGTQIAVGLTALAAQHGKKDAEEQKKSARMMATVNTAAGITKAFATKGWAGAYEAALIAAVGLIQISTINSASYGGGGGTSLNFGGGSAAPAYQQYYEQDPKNPQNYGTGWRPGENTNNYYIVKGDVYAQDSDSFKRNIVNATSENIRDQGDIYDAIHTT